MPGRWERKERSKRERSMGGNHINGNWSRCCYWEGALFRSARRRDLGEENLGIGGTCCQVPKDRRREGEVALASPSGRWTPILAISWKGAVARGRPAWSWATKHTARGALFPTVSTAPGARGLSKERVGLSGLCHQINSCWIVASPPRKTASE